MVELYREGRNVAVYQPSSAPRLSKEKKREKWLRQAYNNSRSDLKRLGQLQMRIPGSLADSPDRSTEVIVFDDGTCFLLRHCVEKEGKFFPALCFVPFISIDTSIET